MDSEANPTTTCADGVVRALAAHGIDKIFCLPGVQNDPFFNAVFDAGDAIRAIHTRHEQGAAYMALGAALATGKPAVYSVVPGPGLLNTMAALATAYSTNAPVFCLTGQIASRMIDRGIGQLHEIPRQLELLRTLTKWAERVTVPSEGGRQTAEAFRMLSSGRPRPVGLEIAPDILATKAAISGTAPLPPLADPAIDDDAIGRAARLLADARQPLIIVGSGAQDASAEVRAIAERLQAPVIGHRMGRGVLDSRHELSHTVVAGYRLWKTCDVVLSIGARAQSRLNDWGADDGLKIVQIDIDPEELARAPVPAVGLLGRATMVLAKLTDALERLGPTRPSRRDEMRELKAASADTLARLEPQLEFLRVIREALPEDGVFIDELTQVGYVSRMALPVYRPRTFISSGYQGTLGWGLATALGVKAARPDVPVILAAGDGGFMYTVQELATAVHHKLATISIVFNDGAYGNVRRIQQEIYGNRVVASDLTNPDFVKLAESFGIMGLRARTPAQLADALHQAMSADAPALIEVPCGPMPNPWPLLHPGKIRGKTPPEAKLR